MSETPMDAKARAQAFAKEHLKACCEEILEWRRTGLFPEDGLMEQLELLCLPLDPSSATRMAEDFVITEALKAQVKDRPRAHAA